jgi:hypothetical protein
MTIRTARSVPFVAVLLAGLATTLPAQHTRFEAAYGLWFPSDDSTAQVFSAGVAQPLLGSLGVGFGLVHVADDQSAAAHPAASSRCWAAKTGPLRDRRLGDRVPARLG